MSPDQIIEWHEARAKANTPKPPPVIIPQPRKPADDLTLRAEWRQDGDYRAEYTSGDRITIVRIDGHDVLAADQGRLAAIRYFAAASS